MPAMRRRRIVRRAVMALVIVVLLVSGYVGAWLGYCFGHGAGWIGARTDAYGSVAFYPLSIYMHRQYPGGSAIKRMADAALQAGERFASR